MHVNRRPFDDRYSERERNSGKVTRLGLTGSSTYDDSPIKSRHYSTSIIDQIESRRNLDLSKY